MTDTKHTPIPWVISKVGNNYDEYMIYEEDGPVVGGHTVRGHNVCNTVYGEANAAFIVKACNEYDEHVKAISLAIRTINDTLRHGTTESVLEELVSQILLPSIQQEES